MRTKGWIYMIICLPTAKCYIGSTSDSKGPNTRKIRHFWELRTNKHHNQHLQNSYNKYGESNFELLIIDTADVENLLQLEQAWIDTINPEFNVCRVSGTTRGIKHPPRSQESKDKLSAALKGRPGTRRGAKVTEETRKKISAAKKGTKLPHTPEWNIRIGDAQKGEKNHMYGKRFKGKPKPKVFDSPYSKPVKASNGIVYGSQGEAARQLGLYQSSIWLVLNGKLKQTGGMVFTYA